MSAWLRMLLLLFSLFTFCYMLSKIRRSKMRIEDSIFWILFSAVILMLSIVPDIAIFASNLLKIQSPINFVFLIVIFLLLIKLFSMTCQVSVLNDKVKTLVQNQALQEHMKQQQQQRDASSN